MSTISSGRLPAPLPLVVAAVLAIAVSGQAADKRAPVVKTNPKAATVPPVAVKQPAGQSDETAIRTAAQKFVEAFNRGDAKAIAALWTPEGSLADDQGRVFKGRKAIEDTYAAFLKQHPGAKMEVAVQSVELPAPGMAVEDGEARVITPEGAPPVASRYAAFHVLIDGKWLMASVRETSIELPSNYRRLQAFQWLVGKWQSKSDAATVDTTVRWLPNKSFLLREYTVRKGGLATSSGMQIIGWDGQTGQVRSWSFDSSGGYGTGVWTPTPEGWRIESKGVLADGTPTASQDFLVCVPGEENVLGWRSVKRKIGNQPLPDLREIVLDRLPEKRTHR